MMIEICICVLLVIPLWHFFWESIFLPSFRLKMRFKLFALRDELRSMRIFNPSILDGDTFTEAERQINVSIQLLGSIDPFLIEQCRKELEGDDVIRDKIDKRVKQFESNAPAQVLQLTRAAVKIAIFTALANSGGWFVYAVPIGSACACFKKLTKGFRELSTAPPHEFEKILHQHSSLIEAQ